MYSFFFLFFVESHQQALMYVNHWVWRVRTEDKTVFFFCALFSAFFLLLTLICIIYRVVTDRWALLLMVLRIFVKTHKQTGAHSNTKKKKTMIRLRTFGCRNCVFTQYRHVNNNEKKWLSFYRFFLSLSVELRLILLFYVLNIGKKKKEMRVEHHVTHFFRFSSFFFVFVQVDEQLPWLLSPFFFFFFFFAAADFLPSFFLLKLLNSHPKARRAGNDSFVIRHWSGKKKPTSLLT